jgi:hypothetical protein
MKVLMARRFKAKKEMEDFWQRRKQASSEDGIQGCGIISHVKLLLVLSLKQRARLKLRLEVVVSSE